MPGQLPMLVWFSEALRPRHWKLRKPGQALIGQPLGRAAIEAAAEATYVRARPLDNTDFVMNWRKQMTREYTLRALQELADTR